MKKIIALILCILLVSPGLAIGMKSADTKPPPKQTYTGCTDSIGYATNDITISNNKCTTFCAEHNNMKIIDHQQLMQVQADKNYTWGYCKQWALVCMCIEK